jgi:PST family polysaccharide transporter
MTGFSVVSYFSRNLDNVLVGKICGTFALGIYSRAYSLFMLPLMQIRNPIYSVALPALSTMQHDPPRFRRFYLRIVTYLAFITMPAVVFSFLNSATIVAVFLGPRWAEASRIFVVFALVGFLQPVASTKELVMIALGNTRRNLVWASIDGASLSTAFIIGVHWGATGVAWAYLIANCLMLLPGLHFAFRGSPITTADFFHAVLRPSLASLAMGALWLAAPHATVQGLIPSAVVGALLYVALWLVLPGGFSFLKVLRADVHLMFAARLPSPSEVYAD